MPNRARSSLESHTRDYLCLTLIGFLGAFSFTVVHPVLPLYMESFHVPYEQVGALFSAYALTWTVLQVYTGYLADRLGRRRMALIGLTIYAAFALLNYTSRSFTQLLLFRILQGVGLGLLGPAILGLAAGFEGRGKSIALYRVANGAGNVLGPIAGGLLGDYSLRAPFLLSALFASLTGGAVLAIRQAGTARKPEARFFSTITDLLRNRTFLFVCIAGFLAELGYVAFDITIPLAGKARGLSTSQIGVVLASYSLSFTLLQVPIGAYAERTDRRRLLASASFLSALFFFGLYAARSFLPLVFLMALLGITLGAVFIQATARAAEVVAEGTQAMSLAFFDSLIDFSFTVMPLIVGFTARFGETVPFLVCTLFLASAGVLFQLTGERREGNNRAPALDIGDVGREQRVAE